MSGSATTTAEHELVANPHPGEILPEDVLKPLGLGQNALARAVRGAGQAGGERGYRSQAGALFRPVGGRSSGCRTTST
jgi:hypothetical protein